MQSYQKLISQSKRAPTDWRVACTHSESTLHQLSPYIGKLKSAIAHDLIAAYSKEGDVVSDVFCGSGTVPLESAQMGRRVFASDASLYAITLTKAKLRAPHCSDTAFETLEKCLHAARSCHVDLNKVPKWVCDFYHPETLKETLALFSVLRKRREYFLLACLLGISHHQRPGFLSYPSSHLVPYLRSRKYPRDQYPEMYDYRPVEPRIRAKVSRALKRYKSIDPSMVLGVRQSTVQFLTPPSKVNCYITSPPYMNALDYGRDNRLRNWFLSRNTCNRLDSRLSDDEGFRRMISAYARLLTGTLAIGGTSVFVVGEKSSRTNAKFPSETISEIMEHLAPCLQLKEIISDSIPDIRRSRRNLTGVRKENILVYERSF